MNTKQALETYYSKRAHEYDEIYHRDDPVRTKEQEVLKALLQKATEHKKTLEIACGTGYWTEVIAQSATNVLATDLSLEMLRVASHKISDQKVLFLQSDSFRLPVSEPPFDCVVAMFWFSHVVKKQIPTFLKHVHSRAYPGATIVMADGNYIKEYGGDLKTRSNSHNTWKKRTLRSGESFDIVKNYYTKQELQNIFGQYTNTLHIHYLHQFWMVEYRLP